MGYGLDTGLYGCVCQAVTVGPVIGPGVQELAESARIPCRDLRTFLQLTNKQQPPELSLFRENYSRNASRRIRLGISNAVRGLRGCCISAISRAKSRATYMVTWLLSTVAVIVSGYSTVLLLIVAKDSTDGDRGASPLQEGGKAAKL